MNKLIMITLMIFNVSAVADCYLAHDEINGYQCEHNRVIISSSFNISDIAKVDYSYQQVSESSLLDDLVIDGEDQFNYSEDIKDFSKALIEYKNKLNTLDRLNEELLFKFQYIGYQVNQDTDEDEHIWNVFLYIKH